MSRVTRTGWRRWTALALVALLPSAAAAALVVKSSVFTAIPTPAGYDWYYPQSFNDAGDMAGHAGQSVPYTYWNGIQWVAGTVSRARAVLRSASGAVEDLGTLPLDEGVPEYQRQSWATDVNNAGQVVGLSYTTTVVDGLVYRAFVWTRAGGMQALPHVQGADYCQYSNAHAVSEDGRIIGWGLDAGCWWRALYWASQTTAPVPLPDGVSWRDVNSAGQVVGTRWNYSTERAEMALWTPGGGEVPVHVGLGQEFHVHPEAINDHGQIVGYGFGMVNGVWRQVGFLWTPTAPGATTGTTQVLEQPGNDWSWAAGINQHGHVTGSYGTDHPSYAEKAFLWIEGRFHDLAPGGNLPNSWGWRVNEHGHVLGQAYGESSWSYGVWSVTLGTEQAATALSVAQASGVFGGTTTLSATLTSGGSPVEGRTVRFKLNGTEVGMAGTDASGTATLPNVSLGTIAVNSYPSAVRAFFDGNAEYEASSGTGSLSVQRWTLAGFHEPVTMKDASGRDVENTVKGGATVPLKFNVFRSTVTGQNETTDPTQVRFQAVQITCATGTPQDEVDETSTGGTQLRYDAAAGHFIQNWQTPKKANTCWRATITSSDGSQLSALFRLR